MKVSTIRELMIFSKLVCELSLGAGGIAVEDSPAENIELAKWTLLDDVIELVLWRCPRRDRNEQDELDGGILLEELVDAFRLTVEEVDIRRPRDSNDAFRSDCSGIPSSHLRLKRVELEAVDAFRVCFLETIAPRSSTAPSAENCECSVGWVRAVVTASRTGKGVKFRI